MWQGIQGGGSRQGAVCLARVQTLINSETNCKQFFRESR